MIICIKEIRSIPQGAIVTAQANLPQTLWYVTYNDITRILNKEQFFTHFTIRKDGVPNLR